jgi:hypothetical protein
VQCGRHTVIGLARDEPFHQRLGVAEKRLECDGILAALLDQVVEELGHLLVEPRVRELVTDDGLADVVDDTFGNRIPRQLPLSLSLRAIASWMPVSMISSVSDIHDEAAADILIMPAYHICIALVNLGLDLIWRTETCGRANTRFSTATSASEPSFCGS